MKDDCIGIIDSGIGGYSILQRLQKACPYESFVYLMDKAHFPYGTKSKTELIRIMAHNVEYLVSRFHIKMLVIACNTATLTTISALKKQFHLPIFGIMPTDVELKGDEVVFCTNLSAKFVPKTCKVIKCKRLADDIEKYYFCPKLLEKTLKKVFKNYSKSRVVLGCTHYLLVADKLHEIYPKMTIIDNTRKLIDNVVTTLDRYGLRTMMTASRVDYIMTKLIYTTSAFLPF